MNRRPPPPLVDRDDLDVVRYAPRLRAGILLVLASVGWLILAALAWLAHWVTSR